MVTGPALGTGLINTDQVRRKYNFLILVSLTRSGLRTRNGSIQQEQVRETYVVVNLHKNDYFCSDVSSCDTEYTRDTKTFQGFPGYQVHSEIVNKRIISFFTGFQLGYVCSGGHYWRLSETKVNV